MREKSSKDGLEKKIKSDRRVGWGVLRYWKPVFFGFRFLEQRTCLPDLNLDLIYNGNAVEDKFCSLDNNVGCFWQLPFLTHASFLLGQTIFYNHLFNGCPCQKSYPLFRIRLAKYTWDDRWNLIWRAGAKTGPASLLGSRALETVATFSIGKSQFNIEKTLIACAQTQSSSGFEIFVAEQVAIHTALLII